jgi:hypothetical protein
MIENFLSHNCLQELPDESSAISTQLFAPTEASVAPTRVA